MQAQLAVLLLWIKSIWVPTWFLYAYSAHVEDTSFIVGNQRGSWPWSLSSIIMKELLFGEPLNA